MDALILSCSTGGGHNAAAKAIQAELKRRGHNATLLDPFSIYGRRLDQKVGGFYVAVAQKTPHLFGAAYQAANVVRRIPGPSPVYIANMHGAGYLQRYLERHRFDVILTTHLYPGEMLTRLRRKGFPLPPTVFVATDYTCIPFTENIECDRYVISHPTLRGEFAGRGLPADRLAPLGIPVDRAFAPRPDLDRAALARELGLDPNRQYYLLSGGSMGAGHMRRALNELVGWFNDRADQAVIVLCGNNKSLFNALQKQYDGVPQVVLMRATDRMADYLHLSRAFLTKPGGLSSTEAAVARVPLVHLAPIPGCETANRKLFARWGLSVATDGRPGETVRALQQLENPAVRARMQAAWQRFAPNAVGRIADLAQRLAEGKK